MVATACAANVKHTGDEATAEVLRLESDVHPEGYHFNYETSNGVVHEEQGTLQGEAISAQGSFQYVSPEGTPVQVHYTADENGFQPTGDHLPVAPPVPDHVVKAIEYIRAHPPKEVPNKH